MLGPGDQILLKVFEMEEMSDRPYPVDGDGNINIPVLGRLKAAGLNTQQLEATLVERLKPYVRTPQVVVTIVQFRSEPVFFVGAFRAPGIYALQGQRTLVEMLSAAGGLLPNASRRIKVTRRKEVGPLPLPNAVDSTDGTVSTVEISMGSLRENVNPAEDIVLRPFDVITVERAEMVYINGEVGRIGPIELAEREAISVAQAITIAGGLSRDANPKKARILRPVMGSAKRAEVPLNIERVLAGQENDFPLLPNDVLHVPRKSGWKRNFGRVALYAVPLASTLIYLVVR
jgi:polysaccharide export outer membrane protein